MLLNYLSDCLDGSSGRVDTRVAFDRLLDKSEQLIAKISAEKRGSLETAAQFANQDKRKESINISHNIFTNECFSLSQSANFTGIFNESKNEISSDRSFERGETPARAGSRPKTGIGMRLSARPHISVNPKSAGLSPRQSFLNLACGASSPLPGNESASKHVELQPPVETLAIESQYNTFRPRDQHDSLLPEAKNDLLNS